ncbi:hypothetical protein B0H13DRAFT_1898261 [Mycena leptocephala]|nr:hypothetical protein B0H13DRAFT_1898261 [Mycena leptocephala]
MNANNSSVILSGITILESPQAISSHVLAFTATIYIGNSGMEDIQGSLRYFRPDTDVLPSPKRTRNTSERIIPLSDCTTKEAGIEVYTSDVAEQAKFLFVGDIKELRLLEALDLEAPEPSWTITRATGSLLIDQATATFTAAPEQFTAAFADAKRAAEAAIPYRSNPLPSDCLHSGFAPLQGREKEPTPYANRYCGFSGYLAGVRGALEGEKMVDRFYIEVDTIAFLGNVVATAPSAKSTPVQSTSQASGSKLLLDLFTLEQPLINFRFDEEASLELSHQDNLGKRKDNNDGAPSSSPSPATGI